MDDDLLFELLFWFLLLGGGFASALGFMVLASFRGARLSMLATFVGLALFCLLAQAGCWQVAGAVGRATNGGGHSKWDQAVPYSFIICALWAGVLFFIQFQRRRTRTKRTEPPKPETFEY